MAQIGDLITFKTLGERKFAIVTGHSENSVLLQSLEPGKDDFITYGFESKYVTNITNQLNKSDETIKKYKQRADEAEKRWSEFKEGLKHKYDYLKRRAEDDSFGPIGQQKWEIARHEVLMALKVMTDFERGEE